VSAPADRPGPPWLPLLLGVYAPAVAVLALAAAVAAWKGLDVGVLTRDPTQVLGAAPYVGALALLGTVLWGATAAVCLFTALLLRRARAPREEQRFVLASGLLTALLGADDALLLHEAVFPLLLGIGETPTYGLYVGLTAAYLLRFRRQVRAGRVALLLAAGGGFAVSVAIDLAEPRDLLPLYYLWEDGPKLLGIVSWGAYLTSACVRLLERDPYRGRTGAGAAGGAGPARGTRSAADHGTASPSPH
jgi:hypothetical protein